MRLKSCCLLVSALLLGSISLVQAHPKHHTAEASPHNHQDVQHEHEKSHEHHHHHDHSHDDFTQLGAHVHGQATLTMVLEGNELQLALQSAAYNIVGFEHAPSNAAQRQEIAIALDTLAQGSWFNLSPEAYCEIQGADANTDLTEPGYTGHGDFYANISLVCQNPARLQQLTLGLFGLTPSLEKISVQWVINGRQGAGELTVSNNVQRF